MPEPEIEDQGDLNFDNDSEETSEESGDLEKLKSFVAEQVKAGQDEVRSSFEASLQQEREQRIRLEEQVKAGSAKPAETIYTRAQLQTAVDEGRMDQAQMDLLLEKQVDAKLDAKLAVIESTRQQQQNVQNQIDRYTVARPDVLKDGTEDRRKVAEAWQSLVLIDGAPKPGVETSRMELKALLMALGPADKIKEHTRETRETHEEVGAGGEEEKPAAKGKPKLSQRKLDHYQHLIDIGQMKDWDAVRATEKHSRQVSA